MPCSRVEILFGPGVSRLMERRAYLQLIRLPGLFTVIANIVAADTIGTEKMVVNSDADWGKSDPLKVPKTGDAMRAAGFQESDIEKVLFTIPITFREQSGKISLNTITRPTINQAQRWENNSALRGQDPVIQKDQNSS